MDFIQGIVEQYPILYSQDGEAGENGFGDRWGWYQSFVRIARELKIRVGEVGSEGLHESLTLLSYLIDEGKEEARQIKQQQR